MAARFDDVVEGLRQRLCDEVRDQFELLREELADRDAQIVKLLHDLQQRDVVSSGAQNSHETGNDQWQYQQMIQRLRRMVVSAVPVGATVAVVSKGDPELLQFEGRIGCHFPQWEDGSYTGFHPKDSAAAIHELDRVCARGARYLVIPETGLWWLDHYSEFARHLHDRFQIVARDDSTCIVFNMPENSCGRLSAIPAPVHDDSQLARQLRAVIASILPANAKVLVVSHGDRELTQLGSCVGLHFPQDTDGDYAGYHPADSATAIDHLEALRQQGAEYIVFPKPAAWWLGHYVDFRRHLETHYRALIRQRHVCTVFDLNSRRPKCRSPESCISAITTRA